MAQEVGEASPGAAAVVLAADNVVGEGLRSYDEERSCCTVSETGAERRDYLTFQQCVLLVLSHRLELVVWIYVGLDDKDFEIFGRLVHRILISVSYSTRSDKRSSEKSDKACESCCLCLVVPAEEASV